MVFLCPKCHRPFSKEVEKKEVVGDDVHEGEAFAGTRSRPYSVDVRKVVVKYRYYYKCKHCGHEWADVKAVEFNV